MVATERPILLDFCMTYNCGKRAAAPGMIVRGTGRHWCITTCKIQ
jgi:hypothetical protein